MNRILQVGNKYLVLITPVYISNASMELLLGNFLDEKISGYHVVSFSNLQDAMDLAYKFPMIDWNKLVNLHIDSYHVITNAIRIALSNSNYMVEFDSHLNDPTKIKEIMFKRVIHHGQRFSLFYDMNDIISINIINPWTQNIIEISKLLKVLPELRIKKVIKTKTHIKLIGTTDADTTYEIRLWTSLIAQWVRQIYNNNLDPKLYANILEQNIEKQKIIDASDIIR